MLTLLLLLLLLLLNPDVNCSSVGTETALGVGRRYDGSGLFRFVEMLLQSSLGLNASFRIISELDSIRF